MNTMKDFNDFLDNDLEVPYHWKKRLHDGLLSVIEKRPAMNFNAFETFLQTKGINDDESIFEAIHRIYRKEVVDKIMYYLCL